jgi:hypothetical protein
MKKAKKTHPWRVWVPGGLSGKSREIPWRDKMGLK